MQYTTESERNCQRRGWLWQWQWQHLRAATAANGWINAAKEDTISWKISSGDTKIVKMPIAGNINRQRQWKIEWFCRLDKRHTYSHRIRSNVCTHELPPFLPRLLLFHTVYADGCSPLSLRLMCVLRMCIHFEKFPPAKPVDHFSRQRFFFASLFLFCFWRHEKFL